MRVIFAGNTGVAERERRVIARATYRLFSYYFVAQNFFNSAEMMDIAKKKVDLFLDSGAFSAWTQGVKIDIQEYIAFIKKHKKVLEVYANLDVIGIGGKQPNRQTAQMTLENQKIMEKAGLKPLPCFHYGEPMEYLDYYVKNYDYLALGVAGNVGKKLTPWLNDCFGDHICDEKGMPRVQVHGFAVTSLYLMLKYPWYSVDSTSWVVTGRLGAIYIPRYAQGKWIYDEDSWKIAVSNRSPSLKEVGKHIDTVSKRERKIILEYIHEKGYDLGHSDFKRVPQDHKPGENERWAEKKSEAKNGERLIEIVQEPGISNTYQLRDEINIQYFLDLEGTLPKWPWAFKNQSKVNKLF